MQNIYKIHHLSSLHISHKNFSSFSYLKNFNFILFLLIFILSFFLSILLVSFKNENEYNFQPYYKNIKCFNKKEYLNLCKLIMYEIFIIFFVFLFHFVIN
ncbi:hypothetical protein PFAG_01398 [Plasmodium falciparum Santa Lucia]|uniref:Uncharacterized protein n=4 Tax=Plasmodium falciparum TaxID=5833 RepID=A0A024XAV1_PLAFC|nr:hypothetical protein PFNF135_01548 [Plasmodium falciparum NF135/5.C10]ETW62609.1 hypothetical protein PFMC_01453 [Plasmodium falciparum CAMP/Malaysia]EUR74998.1 hypothetical protein PFBG_01438 [Plasmodium falciparum 7G8]EUT89248.1 hypothetical protein PFAG_01398 [Plasmodium falciparum Santa Lucia]